MKVFWLSILQGITEFLPVSSSAHEIIFSHLFHFSSMTRPMGVSLNTVTLGVIAIYFRKDLSEMIKGTFLALTGNITEPFHRAMKLCLATMPVIISGYFVHTYFDTYAHLISLMGWTSLIFGILMIVVDRFSRAYKKFRQISYGSAFVMGCFQMIAVIPGVSRAGATLIGARFLGYARPDAAHFSFLMALPVGVGALTLTAKEVIESGYFTWGADLLIMIGLTFVVGYMTLSFFMKWLSRHTLMVWGIYRILFGLFVLYYFS